MDSPPKNRIPKTTACRDSKVENPAHEEQTSESPELIFEASQDKSSLPKMRPEKKEAIKQKLREVSQQMSEPETPAASDEDRK